MLQKNGVNQQPNAVANNILPENTQNPATKDEGRTAHQDIFLSDVMFDGGLHSAFFLI
jgi:hypothetical protein